MVAPRRQTSMRRSLVASVALACSLCACAGRDSADSDQPTSTTASASATSVLDPSLFTSFGGCGELALMAFSADETTEVYVGVVLSDHPPSDDGTIAFDVGSDPAYSVELVRGTSLRQAACNDAPGDGYAVTLRSPAVAGSVLIRVDDSGQNDCGAPNHGVLSATNLRFADGSVVPALAIEAEFGCFSA